MDSSLTLVQLTGNGCRSFGILSRGQTAAESESTLQQRTLRRVASLLKEDEVAIHDAGVCLGEIHRAGVPRYVVRQRSNLTARRNKLLDYCGRGRRPKFGEIVRPQARRRNGKWIAASQADTIESFVYQGRQIKAKGWHNLVRNNQHVSSTNQTFNIWVLEDPAYENPWVLATNLECSPETAYRFYLNRWPIEQIPLVAKQLLGMNRQFVYAHQSCWRLGELAFFTGNILAWLAGILPQLLLVFGTETPKKTPGRLRRRLSRTVFSFELLSQPELRKKNSTTGHLPKGFQAHHRRKPPD